MRVVADLHIHSRFSRATSKHLTLQSLEKWACTKGLGLLGTGDFTHPDWFSELKHELTEQDRLVFTKSGFPFVLQTEVSLIYSKNGSGRRVHHVVLAPGFEVAQQVRDYLSSHGRLDYDGRPIFKIDSGDFVYELKQISKDIEIIPAHIWTPWFSLFGAKSGFDSMEECFDDQTKHIHALETGLSSDPAMNWRLSALDKYTLVSNSDLHSHWPWRIGREANVFNLKKMRYNDLIHTIRTREGFKETIEFFPEEGKYHFDGHRNCNVVLEPKEAMKLENICPVCKKPLTIGVAHRVDELADRPEGYKPKNAVPFKKMLPLSEIIALGTGKAVNSKPVWKLYNQLVAKGRTELDVLYNMDLRNVSSLVDDRISRLLAKNRDQSIRFSAGYDGVYGKPMDDELDNTKKSANQIPNATQHSLLDF